MLNVSQLKNCVIRPTLEQLFMNSIDDAIELLVFTCAVESDGGTYLKQIEGPALGIYQMEPKTYNDIWENYIKNKKSLMTILSSNFEIYYMPDEYKLIYDLRYATAMCRIHYNRFQEKIPDSKDTQSIWEYYKKYYNTYKGSAEKESSIRKYQSFIKS